MFCQLDVLKECKNPSALDKALKSLPNTLQETYDRILLNINVDYQEMAQCALIWLAFSEGPLRVKEVAEAAILNPELNPAFDPENKFFNPSDILGILGSLVTYSSEGIVRIAHFSVQEYLVSKGIKDSKASKFGFTKHFVNPFIAESCLKYIFYYDESDLKTSGKEDLEIFPLLNYVCQFWHIHTKAILPENQKARDCVFRLCLSDTAFLSWLRVLGDVGYYFESLTNIATPLHLAANLGLETIVHALLEKGANVDEKTRERGTALQMAAKRGHGACAKLLLDAGADINAKNNEKATALQLATKFSHVAVVKLLLDEGAEVDPEEFEGTPLLMSARNGDEMIVRLLLAKGADDEKLYQRVRVPALS